MPSAVLPKVSKTISKKNKKKIYYFEIFYIPKRNKIHPQIFEVNRLLWIETVCFLLLLFFFYNKFKLISNLFQTTKL